MSIFMVALACIHFQYFRKPSKHNFKVTKLWTFYGGMGTPIWGCLRQRYARMNPTPLLGVFYLIKMMFWIQPIQQNGSRSLCLHSKNISLLLLSRDVVPLQRCWWYCGRWIIAGWDANPTPRWPPLRLTSPQSPRSRLRPPFAHHLFSSPSSFTQFASRTSATRPRNHACLSKDRKAHISVILICLSFYNFYLLWNFFTKQRKIRPTWVGRVIIWAKPADHLLCLLYCLSLCCSKLLT